MSNSDAADDAKYYAFALSVTGQARPELRAKILSRLVDAVEAEAELRARNRDANVGAATRVRPWPV